MHAEPLWSERLTIEACSLGTCLQNDLETNACVDVVFVLFATRIFMILEIVSRDTPSSCRCLVEVVTVGVAIALLFGPTLLGAYRKFVRVPIQRRQLTHNRNANRNENDGASKGGELNI